MEKMRWGETERRRLHNMVLELKGNIRVFCRMRPLLGEERQAAGGDIKHVKIISEKNMELMKDEANKGIASGTKNAKYEFEFDRFVLLYFDPPYCLTCAECSVLLQVRLTSTTKYRN